MEEISHIEIISCPTCEQVQEATAIESWPTTIRQHECENCQYIITAEEWQEADEDRF